MNKTVTVSFPGRKKVDAEYNGMTVHTDQSVEHGGEGSAVEPFDLFWASLAACSGIYALEFCKTRNLPSEGLAVRMVAERNDAEKRYDRVKVEVTLPSGFPEKYREALKRSVDLCTVKKHILKPPEFETVLI